MLVGTITRTVVFDLLQVQRTQRLQTVNLLRSISVEHVRGVLTEARVGTIELFLI